MKIATSQTIGPDACYGRNAGCPATSVQIPAEALAASATGVNVTSPSGVRKNT